MNTALQQEALNFLDDVLSHRLFVQGRGRELLVALRDITAEDDGTLIDRLAKRLPQRETAP